MIGQPQYDLVVYATEVLNNSSRGQSLHDKYPGLFQPNDIPMLPETLREVGRLGLALQRNIGIAPSRLMAALAFVISSARPTDVLAKAAVVAFGDKLFRGQSGAYDMPNFTDQYTLVAAAESLLAISITLETGFAQPGTDDLDAATTKIGHSLQGLDASYHFASVLAGRGVPNRRLSR